MGFQRNILSAYVHDLSNKNHEKILYLNAHFNTMALHLGRSHGRTDMTDIFSEITSKIRSYSGPRGS